MISRWVVAVIVTAVLSFLLISTLLLVFERAKLLKPRLATIGLPAQVLGVG